MTATGTLARIEARHLARSPLLWLGLGLAAALAALEMSWYLPVSPRSTERLTAATAASSIAASSPPRCPQGCGSPPPGRCLR
jgi:hypothetical protein